MLSLTKLVLVYKTQASLFTICELNENVLVFQGRFFYFLRHRHFRWRQPEESTFRILHFRSE